MRKKEAEYQDSRPTELVQQQTIARAVFVVVLLAAAFFVSQALPSGFNGIERSEPAPSIERTTPDFSLPSPKIRTGYEDNPNWGKARPLFKPVASSSE